MITSRPDINAAPLSRAAGALFPNAVYEMEDGSLVAVSFSQARTPTNTLSCSIAAWQIDEQGNAIQVQDEDGVVLVETNHNAPVQQVAELGVQGIATAMLGLVLGQDPGESPVIPWSAQHREATSIKTAIVVSQAANAPISLSL